MVGDDDDTDVVVLHPQFSPLWIADSMLSVFVMVKKICWTSGVANADFSPHWREKEEGSSPHCTNKIKGTKEKKKDQTPCWCVTMENIGSCGFLRGR